MRACRAPVDVTVVNVYTHHIYMYVIVLHVHTQARSMKMGCIY